MSYKDCVELKKKLIANDKFKAIVYAYQQRKNIWDNAFTMFQNESLSKDKIVMRLIGLSLIDDIVYISNIRSDDIGYDEDILTLIREHNCNCNKESIKNIIDRVYIEAEKSNIKLN